MPNKINLEKWALGLKQIAAIIRPFRDETGPPLFLNLDHGKSFGYIKRAVDDSQKQNTII